MHVGFAPTIDVIRRLGGSTLGQEPVDTITGYGQAGGALPIPLVGSAVAFDRDPTPLEGDLTLAIGIDMGVGLRPDIEAMD